MWFRVCLVSLLVVCCLSSLACGGDPPEKEIKQAQDAIAAAEVSGASQYANEEFSAAREALKRANDAVQQRDYRLALNHALDSLERAQNAKVQAAEGRKSARENADRAISAATMAFSAANAKLKTAERAHATPKALTAFRAQVTLADQRLQEARAALGKEDFTGAASAAVTALQVLQVGVAAFDHASASLPRRHR